MSLAVCLLLDPTAEAVVRRLWHQLEDDGIPTLLSHTHGRHVPHLTLVGLRSGRDLPVLPALLDALSSLPEAPPLPLRFDAFGTFRRSRSWLAPAVSPGLVLRQEQAVDAVRAAGAPVHHHYEPGAWLPHLTLAPRLHLRDLATVAGRVYDTLPLLAVADRAAVVDTSTGEQHPLPHLV